MKWFTNPDNPVSYARGNHNGVAFKFDKSSHWLSFACNMTTSSAKSMIRDMGKYFGCKSVDVRYFWEVPNNSPTDIIDVLYTHFTDDDEPKYKFRIELDVPDGSLRQFKYFDVKDIMIV